MMTLIKRQSILVKVIERVYAKPCVNPAARSRPIRQLMEFNRKRMTFAGYSSKEADDSFRQCCDVARLNAIWAAEVPA